MIFEHLEKSDHIYFRASNDDLPEAYGAEAIQLTEKHVDRLKNGEIMVVGVQGGEYFVNFRLDQEGKNAKRG